MIPFRDAMAAPCIQSGSGRARSRLADVVQRKDGFWTNEDARHERRKECLVVSARRRGDRRWKKMG